PGDRHRRAGPAGGHGEGLTAVRRLPVPLLLALALLAGCTGGEGGEEPADPPGTLRVLAGSELRDVEPLLGQIRGATGVNLIFEYSGTLEGAERITAGGSARPALAWFSSARYLALLSAGAGRGRPVATERIMLSPVVLGVKRSVATRFGWAGNPDVTWKDIAAKAGAGPWRSGSATPAASTSGFSALVGVAAAMAGTGDALRTEDVDEGGLTDFFNGQTLTAGSSGWLAHALLTGPAPPGRCGPRPSTRAACPTSSTASPSPPAAPAGWPTPS